MMCAVVAENDAERAGSGTFPTGAGFTIRSKLQP